MGKAIPGATQLYPILSLLDTDVERLNKPAMRLYLYRRLQSIEARIDSLTRSPTWSVGIDPATLAQMTADEALWGDLLQLDYLEAMRQAVLETLSTL